MKYIFDFDDVLFKNTEMFKPRMFRLIAEAGVPREDAERDYSRPEVRWQRFSLRGFIKRLFGTYNISKDPEKVYLDIMKESHNFLNMELVEEIQRLGKENCYIVTNGEDEFNNDKLFYSGILNYINEENKRIVPDEKGPTIRKICEDNPGEKIVFIDDKTRFIDELRELNIPNLVCVRYKGETFSQLMEKAEGYKNPELGRLK